MINKNVERYHGLNVRDGLSRRPFECFHTPPAAAVATPPVVVVVAVDCCDNDGGW